MNDSPPAVAPPPTLGADAIGRRCLVTGGAGYVGSTLVRRLRAAGCEVRSFDIVDHNPGNGVEVVTGDLRNYDDVRPALEGIDTVFHTAAIISLVALCRPSKRRFVFDVNVGGTKNVARAAAEAGTRAMVHTSTFNVVLDRNLGRENETLPYATRTNDLYTVSKIEAERAALAADESGGLRICALRPGGIWGSDTDAIMIQRFLDNLADNKFKALIGSGKAIADNTHIDNLVDAQLLAACALHKTPDKVGGEAYFITDDETMNCLEWFRPLVEGLGWRFPRLRLPTSLMRLVGQVMEVVHYANGQEPMLTRRSIRNLTESSSFSIDKARRDLGYAPRYNRDNGIPLLLPIAERYIAAKHPATARPPSTHA